MGMKYLLPMLSAERERINAQNANLPSYSKSVGLKLTTSRINLP